MDIKITKTLLNRVFSVNFWLTFTDDDNKLINKFSDPMINYGGLITTLVSNVETASYTLQDNYRQLRAGNGWTQYFDSAADVGAEQKAKDYARIISSHISTGLIALRTNSDDYSVVATSTV